MLRLKGLLNMVLIVMLMVSEIEEIMKPSGTRESENSRSGEIEM